MSPARLYQRMSWTRALSQPIGGFRRLCDIRDYIRCEYPWAVQKHGTLSRVSRSKRRKVETSGTWSYHWRSYRRVMLTNKSGLKRKSPALWRAVRLHRRCLLLSSGAAGTRLSLDRQALLPKGADAINCSLLSRVILRNRSRCVFLLRHSCFKSLFSALARCLDLLSIQMCTRHAQ